MVDMLDESLVPEFPLLEGAAFTVTVMTAFAAEPFQSRMRYGTVAMPIKPETGVKVTTPVEVSTLKVP